MVLRCYKQITCVRHRSRWRPYHVKDWLKNDPAFPKRGKIESYVSSTPALALCGDIANGMKHLILKTTRTGTAPGALQGTLVISFEDSFDPTVEERPPSMGMRLTVEHAGRDLDAVQLAADALQAWEAFVC